MSRAKYPTDLREVQSTRLTPLLERGSTKGSRPRMYPLREIVNGWLYVVREVADALEPGYRAAEVAVSSWILELRK